MLLDTFLGSLACIWQWLQCQFHMYNITHNRGLVKGKSVFFSFFCAPQPSTGDRGSSILWLADI